VLVQIDCFALSFIGIGRRLPPRALEIRQREPAGAEYGEVNESAGYRNVADESVSDHRANFRWSFERPEPDKDERDERRE